MAGFFLEPCGKCGRPIPIPSPVGTIRGGDKMPHIAHKACADPVHAEANPVVVTSREELLGNHLPTELPLPPAIVSHPAPEEPRIEPPITPEDIYEAVEKVHEDAKTIQPSTPVREQQAARRKAPAKKAPAKKPEVKPEVEEDAAESPE